MAGSDHKTKDISLSWQVDNYTVCQLTAIRETCKKPSKDDSDRADEAGSKSSIPGQS